MWEEAEDQESNGWVGRLVVPLRKMSGTQGKMSHESLVYTHVLSLCRRLGNSNKSYDERNRQETLNYFFPFRISVMYPYFSSCAG